MTKYTIKMTSGFKHDYKKIKKSNYDLDLLQIVIDLLAEGKKLPEKYYDHDLQGN